MLVRLQKYMAQCGAGARRKCEKLIEDGRVCVDGQTVTEMGVKIDPAVNVITLDGKPLSVPEKLYIALNKPTGCVTTAADQFGRPTVLDIVGSDLRLFPVGRLDYDSSGLLLLTNDGDFAYMLTHPKHRIEKTYLVTLEKRLSEDELKTLRNGVSLHDGPCRPCHAELADGDGRSVIITISEGRNRQVRRMLEAVGHSVVSLERLSIGRLSLGTLKSREHRRLTQEEVAGLKSCAYGSVIKGE